MGYVSRFENRDPRYGSTNRAVNPFAATNFVIDCEEKQEEFAYHFLKGQKAILAIHAGLKPDEHDVAFNVPRLLHFVLTCLEERNFADAIKILQNLHEGFKAIQVEANEMERDGSIPTIETSDPYIVNI